MAGSVPVVSNRRLYNPRNRRRWGQPTAFQRRYSGGASYAGLNQ
jgi:hypothetical protein